MIRVTATKFALSLASLALVSGCSTKPRNFQPIVAPPPASSAAFQKVVDDCVVMVRSGRTSGFANAVLIGAGGTVAGIAGGVAATSIALSNATSVGGAVGAGGAGAAVFPIVGIAVGFGISRAIRSGREKKIKTAMTTCLGEFGYTVAGWEVIRKTKKKAPPKSQEVTIHWVGVRTL